MKRMPTGGTCAGVILEQLEAFRGRDVPWRDGQTFAHVYDAGRQIEDLAHGAYALYANENGLDPAAFPSLQRIESEVVSMVLTQLKGDEGSAGCFTSGGTESIMLAVKAARDYARAARPQIDRAEIVAPSTVHPAFHKAAHYLGLDLITVPVHEDSFAADVEGMARAITSRTVLLVGSAPSWSHGIVDPIAELGQVAEVRGVLFHVDACVGGFILPYFRQLGVDLGPCDFGVPGVSSISVDLHKYAFAAKGASLVLYRQKALRRHQIFGCASWPGYTVVNPTVQSTKSGGPVAAAWAVLNHLGDDGYLALASKMLSGARRLREGISSIAELRLLGNPKLTLFAVAATGVDVFHVADELHALGWEAQPQLRFGSSPDNLHFLVSPANAGQAQALVDGIGQAVQRARRIKPSALTSTLADLLATLDPRALDTQRFSRLLSMAGVSAAGLPDRMAEINQLLSALDPEIRKELVVEFFNDLYVPAA
jgi:glutamate/tyrosine decarboxylase-like PLP-dependent enzyme